MGERGENASMFVENEGGNTCLSFGCSCDVDTGCEGEVADGRTGMGDVTNLLSELSVVDGV